MKFHWNEDAVTDTAPNTTLRLFKVFARSITDFIFLTDHTVLQMIYILRNAECFPTWTTGSHFITKSAHRGWSSVIITDHNGLPVVSQLLLRGRAVVSRDCSEKCSWWCIQGHANSWLPERNCIHELWGLKVKPRRQTTRRTWVWFLCLMMLLLEQIINPHVSTHVKWCLLQSVLAAASTCNEITCRIRKRVVYCDVFVCSVTYRYLKEWTWVF